MTQQTKTVIAHIGAAIIFCIIGVLGSWKLISSSLIGEKSFIGLIVFSVLISLLIAFMWKVQSFKAGLGSLEVKLKEIKEAESNVKELAKGILELAEADEGSMKLMDWDEDRYEKAKQKLKAFTE